MNVNFEVNGQGRLVDVHSNGWTVSLSSAN